MEGLSLGSGAEGFRFGIPGLGIGLSGEGLHSTFAGCDIMLMVSSLGFCLFKKSCSVAGS